jgi:hypothetical protein
MRQQQQSINTVQILSSISQTHAVKTVMGKKERRGFVKKRTSRSSTPQHANVGQERPKQ